MLILDLDIKKCMSKLLLADTFDDFLFIRGEVVTYNKFSIDGHLFKDFFDTTEAGAIQGREYSLWQDIRNFCLSIIKGKRTPLKFNLVFGYPTDKVHRLIKQNGLSLKPEDVGGLYLNFKFEGDRLILTSGNSLNIFTMDKSLEHLWDEEIQAILEKCDIPFTGLE